MFVSQVLSDDLSCQRVVNEHVARCAARAVELRASSTSAYCEARQRLPITLVTSLCREVASRAHARSAPSADTDMRATLLIDGTGFSMPDTAANQSVFPRSAIQREGCGFPQGQLVALVCAASGAVVEATIGPDRGEDSGEPTALRTMLPALAAGSIVIGDAIYENYWSWAALDRAGCEAVFEINGSRDLPLSPPRRLMLERPRRPPWMSPEEYAGTPERIEVRVVISRRRGCDNRVLISSLLDESEYADETICSLHQSRWDVEICQR